MNDKALGSVVEQRDLGEQVHSSLKVVPQVDTVIKMVLGMLAFISQSIEYKSWEVIL